MKITNKKWDSGKLLHRYIVSDLFNKAKAEKEIYIRIEDNSKIDDKHNEIGNEGSDTGDIIHVSILTEGILNYDEDVFKYFYNNKNLISEKEQTRQIGYVDTKSLGEKYVHLNTDYIIYRPYFFEFQIERSSLSDSQIDFLQRNELIGEWVYGSFLAEKDNIKSENINIRVEGNLLFSASPIRYEEAQLKITDKKVGMDFSNRVKEIYNTKRSVKKVKDIESELKKVLNGANDYSIKLYNVGDGNCIYGYTNNGKRFMFDIGYNLSRNLDYVIPTSKVSRHVYAERALRAIQPNIIILSHWDLDHILGVVYTNSSIFNIPWIAPDLNEIKKTNINSCRLAKYLELLGVLSLLSSRIVNKDIYSNGNLTVWKCKGEADPKPGSGHRELSEPNNNGLAIEIKITTSKGQVLTILPGDAEYLALPSKMNFSKQHYDYLIVPHHASNIDTSQLFKGTTKVVKDAIISASGKHKKHPSIMHTNALTANGYDCKLVGDYSYILIKSTALSKNLYCI